MLENYKVLLWDFDGVIMDSMPIRSNGFGTVLQDYPAIQVKQLMDFHNLNGGLSRYVKFRYFFETIRGETITEEEIQALANSFSEIMLSSLINSELLITDSLSFIELNATGYEMHIVSGSDGTELNKICDALGLTKFFKTINGSPTPKKELVNLLLKEYAYEKKDVILIGDSINDFEAADFNLIKFAGYNNVGLSDLGCGYINSFDPLKVSLNSN